MLKNSTLQYYVDAVKDDNWPDTFYLMQGIRDFANTVENMEQEIAMKDDKYHQVNNELKVANRQRVSDVDTIAKLRQELQDSKTSHKSDLNDLFMIVKLVANRMNSYHSAQAFELTDMILDLIGERINALSVGDIPF